jgi:hypothetical protein
MHFLLSGSFVERKISFAQFLFNFSYDISNCELAETFLKEVKYRHTFNFQTLVYKLFTDLLMMQYLVVIWDIFCTSEFMDGK